MCGIVGVTSTKKVPLSLLMEGLTRLEYRGYDSAGVAWQLRNKIRLRKKAGKVSDLWNVLPQNLEIKAGIAHTRWATHGPANDINAHPHTAKTGNLATGGGVPDSVVDEVPEYLL